MLQLTHASLAWTSSMHEMGLIGGVLKIVEEEANKNKVKKVLSIKIEMGEYSGVVENILREYFEIAAKGTVCEGAKLDLDKKPAIMECKECGWQGEVEHLNIVCGKCGSENLKMISGRQFKVESLEVE